MSDDRSKPPPGYAVWPATDGDPSWPWIWGALPEDDEQPQSHETSEAEAVAACRAHRDRVIADAQATTLESMVRAGCLRDRDREQRAIGIERAIATVREWIEADRRWRLQDALVQLTEQVRRGGG